MQLESCRMNVCTFFVFAAEHGCPQYSLTHACVPVRQASMHACCLDLKQRCCACAQWVVLLLWFLAEVAIAATDLAEIIGSATALNLLFNIPLWAGVLITAVDVLFLLVFGMKNFRILEVLPRIFCMPTCSFLAPRQLTWLQEDRVHGLPREGNGNARREDLSCVCVSEEIDQLRQRYTSCPGQLRRHHTS